MISLSCVRSVSRVLAVVLLVGFFAALPVAAQVNNHNEPGSILVFPLVDNVGRVTILQINNLGDQDVWLQGFMIVRQLSGVGGDPGPFLKRDFYIHLTAHEPFWWDTSQPYNRTDASAVLSQIHAFPRLRGFCFVWAVESALQPREKLWNNLTGEALLLGDPRAYRYNAIPHQGLQVAGDRVLNLDGLEYTMAPSQISLHGVTAAAWVGLCDSLAVCSLDIDFIQSIQPSFGLNVFLWNQDEVGFSRHIPFYQFEYYSLTGGLFLGFEEVFTTAAQVVVTSHRPLWSAFYQCMGPYAWGGNVWQHPGSGVPAKVVLPPIQR